MPARVAQAAQQMRPAVAQLPGPDAELVPGIDRGQRGATGRQRVPGKNFTKLGAANLTRIEADQFRHLMAGTDQIRRRKTGRRQPRIKSFRQAGEAVVEFQVFEATQPPVVFGCVHDSVCSFLQGWTLQRPQRSRIRS